MLPVGRRVVAARRVPVAGQRAAPAKKNFATEHDTRLRKLDKHTARATARVEREAPDSKDTATFLRHARAASLKAMGSRFGARAEEEYDKIAPVIACTLPALTDSIPRKKERGARRRGDE